MPNFVYGSELNTYLEKMIVHADDYLWLISPYIKLHDRIKQELKKKKNNPNLQLVLVFGKNEDDISKSLSKEDVDFLIEFPYVKICYEKNLHAKFYATEDGCLITSMNLHQYSQNNNIEIGVYAQTKSAIAKIANNITSSITQLTDFGDAATKYFLDVIDSSDVLYKKVPEFETGMLGLTKKYKHSRIEKNKLEDFFNATQSTSVREKSYDQTSYQKLFNSNKIYIKQPDRGYDQNGYCIRTGIPIPFNPAKPLSYDAYIIWAQFENWDFPENYCHATGKPSYGKTSMRNPIL